MNGIDEKYLADFSADLKKLQLELKHNGAFPFNVTMDIQLDKSDAGKYANLYYFNEVTKKLELQGSAKIDIDGKASLLFKHASKYVLVVDKTAHNSIAAGAPTTEESSPIC